MEQANQARTDPTTYVNGTIKSKWKNTTKQSTSLTKGKIKRNQFNHVINQPAKLVEESNPNEPKNPQKQSNRNKSIQILNQVTKRTKDSCQVTSLQHTN
jgi:hypothetical protein